MSVFVHAQGIKTVHGGGGGVKKWQNSVHVVDECPLRIKFDFGIQFTFLLFYFTLKM